MEQARISWAAEKRNVESMNAAFEDKHQAFLQGQVAAVSKKSHEGKHSAKPQLQKEVKAKESSSNPQYCIILLNHHEDDTETKRSVSRGQHRRESAVSKRKSDHENDSIKKPKRPMSSYNYFFKEERSLITAALSHAYTNEQVQEVLASFGEYNIQLDQSSDIPGTPLEKKKKFNGVVSFQDICKIIGRHWRSLDQESLEKYSDMAKVDTIRYRDAMEKYSKECDDRELKDVSSQDASDDDADRSESLVPNERVSSDDRNTASAESSRSINISGFEQALAGPFLLETLNPSMLTTAQLSDMNARSLMTPMYSVPTNIDLGLVTSNYPSQTYSSAIPRIGLSNLSSNAFIDSIQPDMNTLEASSFLPQAPRFHGLEQQVAEARLALNYQGGSSNVPLPLQHSSRADVGRIDLDSLLASHFQDLGQQIWQGSQVAAQRPSMEGNSPPLQVVRQALLNTELSNLLQSSRMQGEDPYSRLISLLGATQVPFTSHQLPRAVDAYSNVRYTFVGAGANFSNDILSENYASILLQVLLAQVP